MKKFSSIIVCSASFLLLISCGKETVDPVPSAPVSGYRVKQLNYPTGTKNFNYDGSGKITLASYANGYRLEFTNSPSTIVEDSYNNSNSLLQKTTHNLDGDGLVSTVTNNLNLPLISYYYFNDEKQLVSQVNKENGVKTRETWYTYAGGNLVMDSTQDGGWWRTNKYEYYTNINSTIESPNFGTGYYGKGSKNALKKHIYEVQGSSPVIKNYSIPVLDNLGRIIQTSYTISGGSPVVYTYSYY